MSAESSIQHNETERRPVLRKWISCRNVLSVAGIAGFWLLIGASLTAASQSQVIKEVQHNSSDPVIVGGRIRCLDKDEMIEIVKKHPHLNHFQAAVLEGFGIDIYHQSIYDRQEAESLKADLVKYQREENPPVIRINKATRLIDPNITGVTYYDDESKRCRMKANVNWRAFFVQ